MSTQMKHNILFFGEFELDKNLFLGKMLILAMSLHKIR